MRYSDDSSVCLAAFHAGALLPDGGNIMVKILKGLALFPAENRNGI